MIKAVLFIELPNVGVVADPHAMAIYSAAASHEARQHTYKIVGEPQVTGGGDEPWLLVWDVVSALA